MYFSAAGRLRKKARQIGAVQRRKRQEVENEKQEIQRNGQTQQGGGKLRPVAMPEGDIPEVEMRVDGKPADLCANDNRSRETCPPL